MSDGQKDSVRWGGDITNGHGKTLGVMCMFITLVAVMVLRYIKTCQIVYFIYAILLYIKNTRGKMTNTCFFAFSKWEDYVGSFWVEIEMCLAVRIMNYFNRHEIRLDGKAYLSKTVPSPRN